MTDTVAPDPNPEQTARLVARVRRMMMIATLTAAIGIAALLAVIGYRLFKAGESPVAAAASTVTLPKAARIVSTAVAGERLVLTLDVAGATEIRTFDVRTLKPTGRLTFAAEP
jgi:hypothetical protein